MSEKLEDGTSVPENNLGLEQREKTQQKKIDDLTKEQKREIDKALKVSSKTSRSDWRNGARKLYLEGKMTYEQAKKIIDMMKTY